MIWLFLALLAEPFDGTFRAGLVALNEGRLGSARAQLEVASQLEPRNAQVWLALAQAYWKLRDVPAATTAAGKVEEFASEPATLHALSIYYSESGGFGKAEGALRRAIKGNGFHEDWYFELAQLYLKEQNFGAALEVLDAGRRNFDKSPQLELAAGVAYYGLRRFPEAIDAFLRTVRLDPSVEQSYRFLGRMVDQAEDRLPQITEVFAGLAKRAPDEYLSGFLYGKALRLQDPAKAEVLLRKSIVQNDGFGESHFELGVLLDGRGKFEEAVTEVRRSIELNPDDPVPHYRLARLYDRLGKPAEARAEREIHARLTSAGATGMAGIK